MFGTRRFEILFNNAINYYFCDIKFNARRATPCVLSVERKKKKNRRIKNYPRGRDRVSSPRDRATGADMNLRLFFPRRNELRSEISVKNNLRVTPLTV